MSGEVVEVVTAAASVVEVFTGTPGRPGVDAAGGGGAVDSVAGKTGVVTLDKGDVGLAAVDNTADADKPVSAAQAAADELRAPLEHTHTSANVSDFTEAVQDAVAAMLAAGTNVTLNYDDTGNTLTVTASGGTFDAEAARDALGVALVGVGNISIAVNDALDTITFSTTATVNATDAALRDRSTHTGSQLASTISDFNTAADARVAAGITGKANTSPTATYTKTTASLANNANEAGTYTLGSAQVHNLITITADKASRVRFYATTAQRDADIARAVGVLPTGDHGLLFEIVFDVSDLSYTVTRAVSLFEQSTLGAVPVNITNLSGSTGTVTIDAKAKGIV